MPKSKEKEPTKWMAIAMKIAIALVVAAGLMGACSMLNEKTGIDDDSFLEELIEAQIEQHTGLSLDLTPDSPER